MSDRDPIAMLQTQAAEREPDLVPIRHARMLVTPFTYYRGAALPMAADLASSPSSGLSAQLCGDAHLSNFGMFGSPERHLYFDVNDFDETLPGPFEWDVKRLAASLEVAGRDNGWDVKERRASVVGAVAAYREAMAGFARRSSLEVWYAHLDMDELLPRFMRALDPSKTPAVWKAIGSARAHDSMQAFSRLTEMVDGEPRIVADPPIVVPLTDIVSGVDRELIFDTLRSMVFSYRQTLMWERQHLLRQFRLVDLARKVVGVGSVGLQAWIAVARRPPLRFSAVPPGEGGAGLDARVLPAEERVPQPWPPCRGGAAPDAGGQRCVPRLATRGAGRRQSGPLRAPAPRLEGLGGGEGMTPKGMRLYAEMCGWTLARAHARSGDRIAIAAYLGTGDVFDRAIADFAVAYADQNELDHTAMRAAVDDGRLAR